MNITNCSNEQAKQFFRDDVRLSRYALPNEGYSDLLPSELCLLLMESACPMALLRANEFTSHSSIIHIYVSTKAQRLHLSKQCVDVFVERFITHTDLHKLIAPVPSSCQHVNLFLRNTDFIKEATLSNVIEWHGELVDLHLYSYDLNKYRNK